MDKDYAGLEVNTLVQTGTDKKKDIVPVVLNRANINYYRPWSDPGGGIKTAIYFRDTERALVIECGWDYLKHQLAKSRIVDSMNLDKLTFDQLEQVKNLVDELRKQSS